MKKLLTLIVVFPLSIPPSSFSTSCKNSDNVNDRYNIEFRKGKNALSSKIEVNQKIELTFKYFSHLKNVVVSSYNKKYVSITYCKKTGIVKIVGEKPTDNDSVKITISAKNAAHIFEKDIFVKGEATLKMEFETLPENTVEVGKEIKAKIKDFQKFNNISANTKNKDKIK